MDYFKKASASFRKPVSPPPSPPSSPKDDRVSTIGRTQGLANGLMRKAGVPPQYRAEMEKYVIDSILAGRQMKIRNPDSVLFNSLAGHTCVKDWVQKAFQQYEQSTAGVDEETKAIKRQTLMHGIAILLGEGFNVVQEPNPKKNPFFERDAEGKIVGILNTKPGEPNARFSQCDKAIRSGESLLGGRHRKTRRHHRGGRKSLSRRKLH